MRAYGYLIKMRMLTSLAYRFDVWIGMIGDVILLAATVFIWKAAYGGDVLGSGASVVGLDGMITYTVISVLMTAVFSTGVQNTIYTQVREGNIALDFMRPLNLLGIYLSEDLGTMVSSIVNKAVPLVLMAALLFGFPMPDSPIAAALFTVSCMLSFMILWLMSAMVGLVAFWVAELGNLGMVKDAFVRVLSGSMVPLWFFPEGLQRVSEWLPFQYTYQLPLSVYIGMAKPAEALRGMGVQLIWIALLGVLLAWIWTRARGKVMVQGG
ncbi:ABC transporter permease [Paenibacillus harenae]|uniref:ABC transporter permease n=1 Tax=Paenibacillus harenae TaxID=306543 RepID=UPI000408CF13|nr:ABC-2 family transporter protein [Paenibacillus harenae]